MGFRKRTVTGTAVDASGAPIANGTVQFKLTKALGYTSTHVVVDRLFTTTTNSLGVFSIDLWCDEDSLKAIDYVVQFPTTDSGPADPTHAELISLSYGDGSPKDIGALIFESLPPSSVVTTETISDIIDLRLATFGGGGSLVYWGGW